MRVTLSISTHNEFGTSVVSIMGTRRKSESNADDLRLIIGPGANRRNSLVRLRELHDSIHCTIRS